MTAVQATVDETTKRQAVAILERKGLTMSGAIRLFLEQINKAGDLPFSVETPNRDTIKAMREADTGKNLEPVTLGQLSTQWDTSERGRKRGQGRKA